MKINRVLAKAGRARQNRAHSPPATEGL
jgi:hypothetical protein